MKKKKNNVLFWVCLLVLIAAAAVGIIYSVNRRQRENAYKELASQMTEDDSTQTEDSGDQHEGPEIPIDFETLREQNPDVYAWIHIDDTQVDYPVLQSPGDDDYYLDHTFEGDEGLPGALYTQYSYNPDPFEDSVTVIYGHNMRDNSFFGGLSEYLGEDFRNSHSEILVYTPDHIYHYRVVFAVTYDDRLILDSFDCSSEAGYQAFLTSIRTERVLPSWIEDPFPVTAEDKLLILSTCNGDSDERFLTGAVLEETE